jgi:hypothetical protein
MKSETLKKFISDIFNDETKKSEFIENPQRAMSGYGLSNQERKALMNVHDKVGLVSSDSAALEAALKPTIEWWAPEP